MNERLKQVEDRKARCISGLKFCARAGHQTKAMFALNKHVIGTHTERGVGYDAAADALLAAGFEPPEDPKWFSHSLACNLLKIGSEP